MSHHSILPAIAALARRRSSQALASSSTPAIFACALRAFRGAPAGYMRSPSPVRSDAEAAMGRGGWEQSSVLGSRQSFSRPR